jgi:hypothetical protein
MSINDCSFEVIGRLIGTGRVLENRQEIATAKYKIQILQPIEILHAMGGSTSPAKNLEKYIIFVNCPSCDLMGRKCTLIIEDGRALDFYIANTLTGEASLSSPEFYDPPNNPQ